VRGSQTDPVDRIHESREHVVEIRQDLVIAKANNQIPHRLETSRPVRIVSHTSLTQMLGAVDFHDQVMLRRREAGNEDVDRILALELDATQLAITEH
jgi:hypothetical protein